MTTPRQDRCLVLLSRRIHMSTARALEINFRHAAEVHLPDQTVGNRLNDIDDYTRARRPARCPGLTAYTMQCDSTLLANIRTGSFVTGGQYSTQIRAVSLCQLMIDPLGCVHVRENDAQTVALSTLTGTMGARHGLGRDILRWSYLHACAC